MSRRLDQFAPRRLLQLFVGVMAGWLVLSGVTSFQVGQRLRRVTAELRAERQLLGVERELAAALPATRSRYEQVLSDLDPLEPSGPSRLYLPTLLVQMTERAAAHQLELIGALPDPGESARLPLDAAADPRHRVVLTFAGRFPDLLALLESLPTAPKAIALRAVRLTLAPEDDDGRVVATLAVTGYEVPEILEDNRRPIPAGGFELFRHGSGVSPAPRPRRRVPRPETTPTGPFDRPTLAPSPEVPPAAPATEPGPALAPLPEVLPAPSTVSPEPEAPGAPDEGLPSGPAAAPPTADSGRPERLIRPPLDRPGQADGAGSREGSGGQGRTRRQGLTPEERERLRNLTPEQRERLREQWRQKNGNRAPSGARESTEPEPNGLAPAGPPDAQGLVF